MGRSDLLSEEYIQLLTVGWFLCPTGQLLTLQRHSYGLQGALDASKLQVMFSRLGVNDVYLDTASTSEFAPSYEFDPSMVASISFIFFLCSLVCRGYLSAS